MMEFTNTVHLFVFILPKKGKTVHFKMQTVYVHFGHSVKKMSCSENMDFQVLKIKKTPRQNAAASE